MFNSSAHHTGVELAGPAALITFLWAWGYCAAQHGFLLGFGLGWLPAGILAALVSSIFIYMWPVVACALGLGALSGLLAVASWFTS